MDIQEPGNALPGEVEIEPGRLKAALQGQSTPLAIQLPRDQKEKRT